MWKQARKVVREHLFDEHDWGKGKRSHSFVPRANVHGPSEICHCWDTLPVLAMGDGRSPPRVVRELGSGHTPRLGHTPRYMPISAPGPPKSAPGLVPFTAHSPLPADLAISAKHVVMSMAPDICETCRETLGDAVGSKVAGHGVLLPLDAGLDAATSSGEPQLQQPSLHLLQQRLDQVCSAVDKLVAQQMLLPQLCAAVEALSKQQKEQVTTGVFRRHNDRRFPCITPRARVQYKELAKKFDRSNQDLHLAHMQATRTLNSTEMSQSLKLAASSYLHPRGNT